MEEIKFTLDNLIYSCTTNGKEDIKVVLPLRTPTASTFKQGKEKCTIVQTVDQIQLKLYLIIKNSKIPKFDVIGENKKVNIKFANEVNLQSKTSNLIVFDTIDGGLNWLVKSTAYASVAPPIVQDGIKKINGKTGSEVTLFAEDIHITNEKGPTIVQEFANVREEMSSLKSEITGEIVEILPGVIRTTILDPKGEEVIIDAPVI